MRRDDGAKGGAVMMFSNETTRRLDVNGDGSDDVLQCLRTLRTRGVFQADTTREELPPVLVVHWQGLRLTCDLVLLDSRRFEVNARPSFNCRTRLMESLSMAWTPEVELAGEAVVAQKVLLLCSPLVPTVSDAAWEAKYGKAGK